MLTQEVLQNSPTIAALPDDLKSKVIAEVAALSKNDEQAIIDAKVVEWATNIERDVMETSGIPKAQNGEGKSERYYEYLKRVIGDYKAKAEKASDTTELDKLKKDLDDAKSALKNNTGDAALKREVEEAKQALADEKSRIDDYKKQLEKVKADAKAQVDAEAAKLNSYRTDMEFEKAKNQFTFQDEKVIPKEVRDTYAESAYKKILRERPHEWRKAGDVERLVFLKPDGTVENNPDKGLNPYTLSDYLEKELTPILDKGHQQGGAGTKSGAGGGTKNVMVELGFAKSRAQVDEIITTSLMSQGIAKTHPDFNTKYQEAKAGVANFDQLPLVER